MGKYNYDSIDLAELRKSLGRGYVAILKKRVKKRDGSSYHETSIKRGLTHEHVNPRIVEAAVKLAKEISEKRELLASDIKRFNAGRKAD